MYYTGEILDPDTSLKAEAASLSVTVMLLSVVRDLSLPITRRNKLSA